MALLQAPAAPCPSVPSLVPTAQSRAASSSLVAMNWVLEVRQGAGTWIPYYSLFLVF